MFRRIFRIVISIAVVIWIFLFITKDSLSNSVVISLAWLSFLMFSLAIHGLMAHTFRPPATKEELIIFPLLMWGFWAIMFLVFVLLFIPVSCPDFLMDI